MITPAVPPTASHPISTFDKPAIAVFVLKVAGVPNELSLHISRNGHPESRFTVDELQVIAAKLSALITVHRGRQTSTPGV